MFDRQGGPVDEERLRYVRVTVEPPRRKLSRSLSAPREAVRLLGGACLGKGRTRARERQSYQAALALSTCPEPAVRARRADSDAGPGRPHGLQSDIRRRNPVSPG